MREIQLNGYLVELYDSLDELPIIRFNEYNRYVMIDSGIGSDMEAANTHINTAIRHIAKGDKENAYQVLNNLRNNLHFVVEGTSPKMNAFVCLIKSINGREVTDLSDYNIQKILKKLNNKGLTIGMVEGFLEAVKKKLMRSLKSFSRKQHQTAG